MGLSLNYIDIYKCGVIELFYNNSVIEFFGISGLSD